MTVALGLGAAGLVILFLVASWLVNVSVTRNSVGKERHEIDREAKRLTGVLVATPNMRAKFFTNPAKAIGSQLPPSRYWDYKASGSAWWPLNWYPPFRYRKERALLAKAIFENATLMVERKELSSAVNTDSVYEEFFAPIVRISQRSFTSVYVLSWAAFVTGLALIGIGTYIVLFPPKMVNPTVVGSIFGGSGAVSALGAVYAMATQGIREATLDHASVRISLTAFATQLGHLRAILEGEPQRPGADMKERLDLAKQIGEAIARSTKEALDGISSATASRPDRRRSFPT